MFVIIGKIPRPGRPLIVHFHFLGLAETNDFLMSIPESNFSGVAAHYLASNVQRLESSPGCFVCFQCDANDWKGCWNPDLFQAHINSVHPDSESLSCVFCGSDFPRDRLIPHIASHFASIDSRPFLYTCPMFAHSYCKFQTNNIHCLRIHLRSKHRNEPIVYRCSYCSKQEQSLESLESHISTQALRLYHCINYGCHVKSPSKQALVDHIIRKHGPILSNSLRESVEVSTVNVNLVNLRWRCSALFGRLLVCYCNTAYANCVEVY